MRGHCPIQRRFPPPLRPMLQPLRPMLQHHSEQHRFEFASATHVFAWAVHPYTQKKTSI